MSDRFEARASPAPLARRWVDLAGAALAPALGAAMGAATIILAEAGAGPRPALTVLIVAVGGVAGLAPLRFGLPVAIVLASFNGLFIDFAGGRSQYWNELFVVLLVGRALRRRRPAPHELVIVGAIGGVYGAYLLSGTKLLAAFWGLKILLTSVVAGWAVFRLEPRWREWRAAYLGLAVAVGGSLVLAAWQHSVGAHRLRQLGIPLGERIKESSPGTLRVFAGFTSPAPFSYALVVALLVWLAFLLGDPRDRRLALATAWVPVAALIGIAWSLDRTALVGLSIAVLAVGLRQVSRPRSLVLVGVAAVIVVAIAAASGPASRGFLREGVTLSSPSAEHRISLWRAYLEDSSVFGAGPASAGSGYQHTDPPAPRRPAWLWAYWRIGYTRTGIRLYAMETQAWIRIGLSGEPRPATTLVATGKSFYVGRRVTVHFDPNTSPPGRVLGRARLVPRSRGSFSIAVPAGPKPALVILELSPSVRSRAQLNPADGHPLGAEFEKLAVRGLRPPPTPAEAVYEKTFAGEDVAVVDNLYVSWVFQYGVFGVVLCLTWLGVLLWPMIRARENGSLTLATRLVGVFLVVGAVAVNIWEEAPTDLLAAIVFACALASTRRREGSVVSAGENGVARAGNRLAPARRGRYHRR